MLIQEHIAIYDLTTEEQCALNEVLYRLADRRRDRRKPEVNIEETMRKALLNSAICRGSGIEKLEQMYAHIMQYLTDHRKEYRC